MLVLLPVPVAAFAALLALLATLAAILEAFASQLLAADNADDLAAPVAVAATLLKLEIAAPASLVAVANAPLA